jgi:two-component system sensor histidine kinase KdpD
MARGELRIYLGAAPGVGKTFAMLNEGRRRASRGTDVVVGIVETHGRAKTAEQVGDLEIIPRRKVGYRGTTLEEMDVDAILARHPDWVLVDEMAHTNVPGSEREKRWEDVDVLLDAGINVISTLNIQHLESMNDVVEQITGIKQHEKIPDAIVRRADQVELVDMTPEALRRRMAHGNIYGADRVDAALANYFRVGNLGALRELALMWVADKVDDALIEYRQKHGIERPWETRERVVVALTGAPNGQEVIRRAARISSRTHGDLIGVHVRSTDGLSGPDPTSLDEQRKLLADLGGEYHELAAGDVAGALVQFARSRNATQVVLGASKRSRWAELTRGSVINSVVRNSGTIDVHVISTESSTENGGRAPRTRRVRRYRFSSRRIAAAWATALIGPWLMVALLVQLRAHLRLPSDLLAFLLVVVVVAALGGFPPSLVAAIESFLLANWYFTPPIHTWTISEAENLFALVIFVAVAAIVSFFVSQAARRSLEAAQARADAETLAALAGTMTSDDDPLPALAAQLQVSFDADGVSVLRRRDDHWAVEASAGERPPATPDDAAVDLAVGADTVVALAGASLREADARTLEAFSSQLALALERRRLRAEAETAVRLSEVNELRAGLLAAVSHDLRTPLASIKASVTSLRQDDISWTNSQRDEFLGAIDEGVDRLTDLVTNLLGMSRINAGQVELATRPVGIDEILPLALAGLEVTTVRIVVDVPDDLPPVWADVALLERVLANIIDNACKYSPPGCDVTIRAGALGEYVSVFVIDHGAGIPMRERERVFEPFQRVGDRSSGDGTGLGLAVAKGFVELMSGEVSIEDTPGGGTTMVVTMPAAT